jgi:uncharacterized protein (TIGR03437 family)
MSLRAFVCLALVSATGAGAASNSVLGVDYSEWLGLNAMQINTDASGALYIASGPLGGWASTVTRVSADGKTMVWQNQLGFSVAAMAVDPNGGVYVIPLSMPGDTSISVAKLSANGTGLAWKAPIGFIAPSAIGGQLPPVVAADSQGRTYVAASNVGPSIDAANDETNIVQLNAAGTAIGYTAQVKGIPTVITVDPTGAAFVAGYQVEPNLGAIDFVARVAPDGSAGFYTTLPPQNLVPSALAVDVFGNADVFEGGALQRVNPAGVITFSTTVAGGWSFVPDAAGNMYIAGFTGQNFQVKNSIATCGWDTATVGATGEFLTVLAPDGSVLQTTYVPGGQFTSFHSLITMGPNSTFFVVASAGASFAPTQAGPFPAGSAGSTFLLRLSPNANAQILPLTCMVNGASLATGAIAPGEMVTLSGAGLGPQQAVQSQASLESPFPTQSAGVAVTFDGKPAPLLWVQDAQINAVAPWSLTPGQNTKVCASYNSVSTNCLTWPVVQSAPAVFTVDGSSAVAVNQDGTMNSLSNPAPVGSIVTIWATGLGAIAPPQADGALVQFPLPTNTLAAGVQAWWCFPFSCSSFPTYKVTYAGPAPYLLSGVTQINFQVVSFPGLNVVTLPSTQSPLFGIFVASH